jgi:hypothetical protein
MTKQEKDWILSLPIDFKIELMKGMLKDGEIGQYLQFIDILLEAPISKGGLSTELINQVFNNWKDEDRK